MPIIKVEHLSKIFDGNTVLNDISVDINKGDVISIIGPSGTGKSTFLRCLNLLEMPTSGSIIIESQDLLDKRTNISTLRQRMGMVFQSFNLFSHLMIVENIMLGQVQLLNMSKQEAYKEAMELLKMVGLESKAYSFPDELSGGQKQRVAIARTLAMKPEIILFDEPTSALDPTMVGEVLAVIKKLAHKGMTMMIVTHEMQFAKDVSNRVFYMDEGSIYEQGNTTEIFENPQREKTKAFIYKIRNLCFSVMPCDVDIYKLNSRIEDFCFKNLIGISLIHDIQLLVEELVLNILFTNFINKKNVLDINLSVNHREKNIKIKFEYNGPEYLECLNETNIISQKIIKNKAEKLEVERQGDLNIITVTSNFNSNCD